MSRTAMTEADTIPGDLEFLFPAVFHFYKQPLVAARAGAHRIPGQLGKNPAACVRDS
jgi:hypothetical protein